MFKVIRENKIGVKGDVDYLTINSFFFSLFVELSHILKIKLIRKIEFNNLINILTFVLTCKIKLSFNK